MEVPRPDHRLRRALDAVDAANADDPVEIVVRGERRPKELAHAELVTEWIARLAAEPTEALLLAARAHHLRRWTIPRSSFPDGRAGYLRWRRALHDEHARGVAEIMREHGYADAAITRVESLVRKRGLGRDPEAQALEDALCLVFLETQFHDLAARLDRDKTVEVVRKTLAKMSDEGRQHALAMPLDPSDRSIVEDALAP